MSHYCRTRIKICGFQKKEDVKNAIQLGIDSLGFIFADSLRQISIREAKTLLEEIPPFVTAVAVFSNPTFSQVQEIIQELPIHLLQFHGQETAEFCEQFQFPYIKGITVQSKNQIEKSFALYDNAKAILLDAPKNEKKNVFNWEWVLILWYKKPIILAGGLTAQNVKEAIRIVEPYAVDVCSGVELKEGIKDYAKMIQFIHAVRSYDD